MYGNKYIDIHGNNYTDIHGNINIDIHGKIYCLHPTNFENQT